VLDADPRFGARTVVTATATVSTTVAEELEDSALRVRVHTRDVAAQRRILDALATLLATHPETAGRRELMYERPCSLHLCSLRTCRRASPRTGGRRCSPGARSTCARCRGARPATRGPSSCRR